MKCENCDLAESLNAEDEFEKKMKSGKYVVRIRKIGCEDCGESIEIPTLVRKARRVKRK